MIDVASFRVRVVGPRHVARSHALGQATGEVVGHLCRNVEPVGGDTRRKALIRQFEKRLFEQAYQQPLLWWHRIVPTHKTLMGWQMSPSHNLGSDLATVWLN